MNRFGALAARLPHQRVEHVGVVVERFEGDGVHGFPSIQANDTEALPLSELSRATPARFSR